MATATRRNLLLIVVPLVVLAAVLIIPRLGNSGARPVVGEVMPDFTVTDSQGERFQLSAEYAEGPVVLIFYRGYWCGICQNQLQELEQIRPDIEALGAQIVAVSTDARELAERARVELGLGFRILPDDRLRLLRMFDHAEIYSNEDIFNPAIYVIDEQGIVRWGYFGEHAADRPTPQQVLDAVRDVVEGPSALPHTA